jgi:hypothetical protein
MHELTHARRVTRVTPHDPRIGSDVAMRIPHLVWNRRHNVAALTVSYGRRVWQTREVGDLILGYNAAGRLSRVVILDPRRLLCPGATAAEALEVVTTLLLRTADLRQADLDVLRSAIDRARVAAG